MFLKKKKISTTSTLEAGSSELTTFSNTNHITTGGSPEAANGVAVVKNNLLPSHDSQPPPLTTSPWQAFRRAARRRWHSTRMLYFRSMPVFFTALIGEYLPIIGCVRYYNVQTMLMKDILAGLTCGIMQVPQGMAYGMLSLAGPVDGLYTAFVTPLVYSTFASSRHVSVASFAVLSMMTASLIQPNVEAVKSLLISRAAAAANGSVIWPGTKLALDDGSLSVVDDDELTRFAVLRLATSIDLACGVVLLGFGVLRLGFISCYLSDTFIAGLCAGAAVHVFTSQLFPAFGLVSSNPSGWFMLYYSYNDFFQQLRNTKLYTLCLSLSCIVILYAVKTYVNGNRRLLAKLYGIPVPVELVLVVVTTMLSYYFDFDGDTIQIGTVGTIPHGLPAPTLPDIGITRMVFFDTILLSFVVLALTISIGRVLAKKNDTPIDANTELRALGLCNVAGSFFSCIPAGCAMARTMVLADIGMQTQLASFIGCAIVFVVLEWLAAFLEPLPRAVLAAIVIVAVKPLFMTIVECWRLLKVSWLDASIYLVTFIAIILGQVSTGAVVGVAYSIFSVILRTQYPKVYVLGRCRTDGDDYYEPIGRDDDTNNNKTMAAEIEEIQGVRILRIAAPIYFANVDYLRTKCLELVLGNINNKFCNNKHDDRCVTNNVMATKSHDAYNAAQTVTTSKPPRDANDTNLRQPSSTVDDVLPLTYIAATSLSSSSNSSMTIESDQFDNSVVAVRSVKQQSSALESETGVRHRTVAASYQQTEAEQIVIETDNKHCGSNLNEAAQQVVVNDEAKRNVARHIGLANLSSHVTVQVVTNDVEQASDLSCTNDVILAATGQQLHRVILDCSAVSFIDTAGVAMLVNLVRECKKKASADVVFAHCPSNVREQIRRNYSICGGDLPDTIFFATIQRAVAYNTTSALHRSE